MINRTFKFYTKAFSQSGTVTVTAKFNGEQVYSGPVSAVDSPLPTSHIDSDDVTFEYTGPIDMVGQIPFELTVQGGTVFFGKITTNYSGIVVYIDRTDTENHTVVVTTPPENSWSSPSRITADSDGKTNVMIDGVVQLRNLLDPTQLGDWWYMIPNNSKLTCDIFVDPARIVSTTPTIQELEARNLSSP